MKNVLLVGLGGFFGSIIRYGVGLYTSTHLPLNFPYGTLIVNLAGSLLIGILSGYFIRTEHLGWQLFLITGFCGGFTTFSAFSLDNFKLLRENMYSSFFLYSLSSVIGGIFLCILGIWISSRLFR